MIRGVWAWLRGLRRKTEGRASTTPEVETMLRDSEVMMHEAELEAVEAEALTASLKQMRVQNQFKERMTLKIQGGLR